MKNYTIEDLQLIAENLPREDLTKIKTRIKKLNSQFISLKHSTNIEDVQSKMDKVSAELKLLKDLYQRTHNEVILENKIISIVDIFNGYKTYNPKTEKVVKR
jgi:predicted translin family RNA/ssDNA-binding protein